MAADCPPDEVFALLDDEYARALLSATSHQPMTAPELSEQCSMSKSGVYRRLNKPEESSDELVSLPDLPPLFHKAVRVDIPDVYEGVSPLSGPRDHIAAEHEVNGDPVVGVRSLNWLYEIDHLRDKRYVTDVKTGEEVDASHWTEAELRRVTRLAEDRITQDGADNETSSELHLEAMSRRVSMTSDTGGWIRPGNLQPRMDRRSRDEQ